MFKDLRFAILKLLDYTEGMRREADNKMISAQIMLYKIDIGAEDYNLKNEAQANITESELILKLTEGMLKEIKKITEKADELETQYK